jgi:hypothetical protein
VSDPAFLKTQRVVTPVQRETIDAYSNGSRRTVRTGVVYATRCCSRTVTGSIPELEAQFPRTPRDPTRSGTVIHSSSFTGSGNREMSPITEQQEVRCTVFRLIPRSDYLVTDRLSQVTSQLGKNDELYQARVGLGKRKCDVERSN